MRLLGATAYGICAYFSRIQYCDPKESEKYKYLIFSPLKDMTINLKWDFLQKKNTSNLKKWLPQPGRTNLPHVSYILRQLVLPFNERLKQLFQLCNSVIKKEKMRETRRKQGGKHSGQHQQTFPAESWCPVTPTYVF